MLLSDYETEEPGLPSGDLGRAKLCQKIEARRDRDNHAKAPASRHIINCGAIDEVSCS